MSPRQPHPSHGRMLRRAGLIAAMAAAGVIATALPASAHAGFSSYAGFSYQPNPLGSSTSPYEPGTRYTLVVRAAVETTQPYNGSDDTDVRIDINVPTGWTDPACGSAMLQVNNSGTGFTNQPGAAVVGWACQVLTVGSNKVIRFSGPQVSSPATKADSAQFFSFQVTTPSPSTKTTYSGAGSTQGFIVDQTYASGANSHWYPDANYPGTAPDGTTRNELATGLVRTVAATHVPGAPTVTAAPRAGKTLITWTTPTGGLPITSTTVTLTGGASPIVATITPSWIAAHGNQVLITGLNPDTTYSATVRATNSLGVGTASTPVTVTPRVVPTKPLNPTLGATTATTASVMWTTPTSNGGSAITGYTIRVYTLAGGSTPVKTFNTSQTNYLMTGLTTGANYTVKVVAVNAAGTSPESSGVRFRLHL